MSEPSNEAWEAIGSLTLSRLASDNARILRDFIGPPAPLRRNPPILTARPKFEFVRPAPFPVRLSVPRPR